MKDFTRKEALAEAVRRWGKRAAIRDEGKHRASTPEQRADARAALTEHRKGKPQPIGTATWLTLSAEERAGHNERFHAWKAEHDRLFIAADSFRFTVGTVSALAFHIEGHGDTWREAFADVDSRAEWWRQKLKDLEKEARRGKRKRHV